MADSQIVKVLAQIFWRLHRAMIRISVRGECRRTENRPLSPCWRRCFEWCPSWSQIRISPCSFRSNAFDKEEPSIQRAWADCQCFGVFRRSIPLPRSFDRRKLNDNNGTRPLSLDLFDRTAAHDITAIVFSDSLVRQRSVLLHQHWVKDCGDFRNYVCSHASGFNVVSWANAMEPQIVAMGGGGFATEPEICFLNGTY